MAEADGEACFGFNVPHEVVIEILSLLPIKSLFQYRCVSKTWLQFLTLDPYFAKLHCDRSIQSNKLNPNPSILAWPCDRKDFLLAIDYTACDKAIHLDLPFHEGGDHRYTICGVCNGLLCLNRNDDKEVYVWNPLTKEYITISCPPPPYFHSADAYTKTVFGFGWVQENNEYKVMRATCCQRMDYDIDDTERLLYSQVSVYTLGVDLSWRIIDEDIQYNLNDAIDNITLVNGVLHWIAWRTGASSHVLVVGFDLKDEFFREIPTPSAVHSPGIYSHVIGELGGYLCLYTKDNGSDLEIWMMMEYGVFDSWTKRVKVSKAEDRFFIIEPVGMACNGDLILQVHRQDLTLCNLQTGTVVTDLKQFGFNLFVIYTFMGSLISPRVISRPRLTEDET